MFVDRNGNKMWITEPFEVQLNNSKLYFLVFQD